MCIQLLLSLYKASDVAISTFVKAEGITATSCGTNDDI